MDTFIVFVFLVVIVALAFFGFGVLAGYHAGRRAGRMEAVDEMQPSYGILLTELSKVPNQYKDFDYSDNPLDETWNDYHFVTAS